MNGKARGVLIAAAWWCAVTLASCGGGGGLGATTTPTTSGAAAGGALPPVSVGGALPPSSAASVASTVTGEQAKSSDAFVDSIGLNLHLNWGPAHDNYAATRNALIKLGVRHLRDGLILAPQAGYYPHLIDLASLGIHSTLITALTDNPTTDAALVTTVGTSMEAIEAPNEANTGTNWVPTLAAFQKALYTAVKSNPHSAQLTVIGPALSGSNSAYATLGNLSAYLDEGNMHDYAGGYNPGNGSIGSNLAASAAESGTKPIVSTETGYCTSTGQQSVSPTVMGRYIPRLFLEHFNAGVPRTFEYELLDDDDNAGNLWTQCGLLTHEFVPKPAFTALANLTALLADRGTPTAKVRLNYTLTAPANVHHTLLQKNDSSFYLALWVEASGYDPIKHLALTVAPQTATVTLGAAVKGLTQYAFDDTGALAPLTLSTAKTTLAVTVTDRVTILKIVP